MQLPCKVIQRNPALLFQDPCISVQLMPCADAYVVVYSVADKESFDEAVEVLHEIAKDKQRVTSAVILVANKGDIVRNRTVTEDGKMMTIVAV